MAKFIDNQAVGDRLRKQREKTELSARKFAMKAGVDQSQYSKIEKAELPITENILSKLIYTYKFNREYILYGTNVPNETKVGDKTPSYGLPTGTDLIETEGDAKDYLSKRLALKNHSKKRIPFYDAEAVGGITETEMTPIHAPSGTIDIGDLLNDSHAAIRIYGNSMLPNYPPGCVVGLVKCDHNFIEPGEVYVIETRDRRILKRLFYPNDKPESEKITCYSDNIMKFEGGARHGQLAYPPFDIQKKEIINLFVVTGVIKRNSNSVIINR